MHGAKQNDTAASIHFSDGGGGKKLEKCPKNSQIWNFAREARRKNANCVYMFSGIFMLNWMGL